MAAPRSTAVGAILGLVVGIAATLVSTELRADRDVALQLLRANELLADRLVEQRTELQAAREDLAAVRRSFRSFDPVVGDTRACDGPLRRP